MTHHLPCREPVSAQGAVRGAEIEALPTWGWRRTRQRERPLSPDDPGLFKRSRAINVVGVKITQSAPRAAQSLWGKPAALWESGLE